MKTFTDFEEIVDFSVKYTKENEEFSVENVELVIEGKKFYPYTVSICNRDLLFYCEQGTINFVVDSYGDDHMAEAFDWDLDEDN